MLCCVFFSSSLPHLSHGHPASDEPRLEITRSEEASGFGGRTRPWAIFFSLDRVVPGGVSQGKALSLSHSS